MAPWPSDGFFAGLAALIVGGSILVGVIVGVLLF